MAKCSLSSVVASYHYIKASRSFMQEKINFGLQQIGYAKELNSHYEAQVVEYHLLLDVAVHSDQKRVVESVGKENACEKYGTNAEPGPFSSDQGDAEEQSNNDEAIT